MGLKPENVPVPVPFKRTWITGQNVVVMIPVTSEGVALSKSYFSPLYLILV